MTVQIPWAFPATEVSGILPGTTVPAAADATVTIATPDAVAAPWTRRVTADGWAVGVPTVFEWGDGEQTLSTDNVEDHTYPAVTGSFTVSVFAQDGSASQTGTVTTVALATVGTAGNPGTWDTAVPPVSLEEAQAVASASPETAWTTGQHVHLRDGTTGIHWTGTAWAAGAA